MTTRILLSLDQLYRDQPGGIGTYVRGLMQGLLEVGSADDEFVGLVPKSGAQPLDLPIPSLTAPGSLRALTALWRFAPVGVPRDVDVVHAPSFAGPFSGGRESARHSVTIHDVLWRDDPSVTSSRGARFHESRLRYIMRNKDLHLFIPSPPLLSRLANEGVDPSRMTPIRLGVDDDGVEPVTKASIRTFLANHGVDGPFTLYVGTREPRKNLERLVRAHEIARKSNNALGPLVLAGPAGWGREVSSSAITLGLVDRNILKGLLRDAQMLAYVPLAEGWGLPPIESLAQGTPVVASATTPSVAGNHEVTLVDPLSIESIVEGILTTLQVGVAANDRRRRQGSVADLTWASMAKEHLAVWR